MLNAEITAIIVDDEPLLRHHLNQALGEYWPELEIMGTAANGEQALELIEQHQPDIAFLDIKMPLIDGMAVAKQLLSQGAQTRVVFVTAYDEYAVQAFEENAIDFLLKPLSDERLKRCIDKLKAQIPPQPIPPSTDMALLLSRIQQMSAEQTPKHLNWIKATKGEEIHLIAIDQVLYFHAQDKYVSLYRLEEGQLNEYLLRTSLKELLAQLDPERFWQVHRSIVVNVSTIDKVKKDFTGKMQVVIHGKKLPVSRAMQNKFSNQW